MKELTVLNVADQLKNHLEELSASMLEWFPQRKDWRYTGFEKAILEHGVFGKPKPRPRNVKRGLPKLCYYNCQQIVSYSTDFTYVEGYAVPQGFSFLTPINHAWLIDKEGNAIDPTWESVGLCYLGIPLQTTWLKTVWEFRRQKDSDCDITIFQGNYSDNFSIVKDGFPVGAIANIP